MDRKGAKSSSKRASRKGKKCGNRFTQERDTSFLSTSAKKLRGSRNFELTTDPMAGYCVLQFVLVFMKLSELLICKQCKNEVRFGKRNEVGLGFKLTVECTCRTAEILSCPKINGRIYEINRRLVFVMRLLGLGINSINLFCSLMDIFKGFSTTVYYDIVQSFRSASETVFTESIEMAANEENIKNTEAGRQPGQLIVSGDGTWSKRGHSALFGISTLIGEYSKKIIDIIVKSRWCRSCSYWKGKRGTPEYDSWKNDHENECTINHEGSAGKMEVDGIIEMFQRSETLHGVRYTTYIGDGDSKTFKGILDARPYGDEIPVSKKECVGHVQKRMGTRLRNIKKDQKGLGGRGPGTLTNKLIEDLTIYYGLAIRRNPESVEDMRKAIWATFYHKCSTDENPQHFYCPEGPNSWCKWRIAEATGSLKEFHHEPPLSAAVQNAIKSIYEDLSREDLLQRCLGGHTQNSNESFNSTLWQLAPKHHFSGANIIEIAAHIGAVSFNNGFCGILKVMEVLGIRLGPLAIDFAKHHDDVRIQRAEHKVQTSALQALIQKRMEQEESNAAYEEEEGFLYGPGIAE